MSLVATMSLPVTAKPDIWYGDATTNRVVKGDGPPTPRRSPLPRAASARQSTRDDAVATSQTGQSLRQVARALEKVPDDAVRDAAELCVDQARAKGGTFAGKRLGAKVKPNKKGSVFVVGTPAGAWAIKSYGRSSPSPPVGRSVYRAARSMPNRRGPPGVTSVGIVSVRKPRTHPVSSPAPCRKR